MTTRLFWLMVATLLLCEAGLAAPVVDVPLPGGYFNSQYSAGTGSNVAYFITDFGGSGGGVHGFSYRWDGTQTADNAMIAIDVAGTLDMETNNFGSEEEPNLFISRLTYPPDDDEPDFFEDGRFWHYWLGEYESGDVSWTESQVGISGRDFLTGEITQTLLDGGFYGFYASADAVEPRLPVANPSADFDDDNVVDADDIDILWQIVRGTGSDPGGDDTGDLDGDENVNEDDVDFMLAGLLDAGPNRQYGDADLDGGVGGLDYTAWRQRAGTGWANGDFDGDGGVGGLDYTLWRTRPTAYPGSVGPHGGGVGPGALVPEPSTIVLGGIGLLMLSSRVARRVGLVRRRPDAAW